MTEIMTPWFPSKIKPVHVGEYEVHNEGLRCWLDGKAWSLWYFPDSTAAAKSFLRNKFSLHRDYTWRGLKDPK